jgi:hypothetical protein
MILPHKCCIHEYIKSRSNSEYASSLSVQDPLTSHLFKYVKI